MKRSKPLRAKAPPPRPVKVIDYTPRPRAPAAAAVALPMANPVPKDDPARDEGYRRLVAALPCIHCGREKRSQAAHGPALGKSIKASDDDLFPLCADEPGALGCHSKFDLYILFDAEQRREVAATWAAQTRARLGRPEPGQPRAGSCAAH